MYDIVSWVNLVNIERALFVYIVCTVHSSKSGIDCKVVDTNILWGDMIQMMVFGVVISSFQLFKFLGQNTFAQRRLLPAVYFMETSFFRYENNLVFDTCSEIMTHH